MLQKICEWTVSFPFYAYINYKICVSAQLNNTELGEF